MPTIPTYDNFKVADQGGFQGQIQGGKDQAGQIAAKQAEELGQAELKVGNVGAQIATDMQAMVNQTRVNDANNQLREVILQKTYDPNNGYLALKGKAALDPDDSGQSMPERYTADVQNIASMIGDKLGNDMQRQAFKEQAQQLLTSFNGNMQQHLLGEFASYHNSVQDGTIDLNANSAKLQWNDPSKIAPSLDAIKAAVYEKGRLNGWSGSQIEASTLKTTSSVHHDIVMEALTNNNPNYALGYLERYKGEMTADDILRVQGQVNQQVWANQALSAVNTATTHSKAQFQPNDFDRMVSITLGSESRGQDFDKNGNVLTSPKGAKGKMQVLDSTNKDPGFGVKGAQNDSLEERARVGRDYLQALLQHYGDPAKAWAAYNAGPGALDSALAAAKNPKNEGKTWLDYLPKETQNYVTKNLAQLGSGGGAAPRPTIQSFVDTALAQLPPGAAPQVIKLTRDQAEQQYNLIDKTLKEQGDNAVRNAQQWIAQNNGNFTQLPPPLRAAVTQYAPDQLDNLIKYSKSFEKQTETNMALYQKLATDKTFLTKMSDSDFYMLRPLLSDTDFRHFINERAAIAKGQPGDIDRGALNQTLDNRLAQLGIAPHPKPASADAERVGAIRKFVTDSVLATQTALGKKLDDASIERHIDGLFSKSVQFKTDYLFGGVTTHSAQRLLGMNVGDIPGEIKDKLKADFKSHGIQPTDADLLGAYFKLKTAQR